jgi:hypothetical protein
MRGLVAETGCEAAASGVFAAAGGCRGLHLLLRMQSLREEI